VSAALGQLGGLARRLQEVRATVSLGRRSAFDRIIERPGLGYQLGLDDVPDVQFDTAQGRENRFDRSRDVSGRVSSGLLIVRGVSLTGEFSRTQSKQERSRNNQEQQSTTWPRLSLNWGNVERIKVLQPLVESATATTAFQQTKDLRGTTLDAPDRSETTRREWSPLLSVDATLVNGLRADLTTNRSQSSSVSGLGGGSESREVRASYQLGFEYRIQTASKVSMPLLGKGEPTTFTSELGLGLNFNLQTDKDEVFSREVQGFVPQSNTRSWNVSPRATYSFSRNVSGSLDLKYGENHNLKNESQSRRTIGVSAAATLRF
jgi:cell surface protein SprA